MKSKRPIKERTELVHALVHEVETSLSTILVASELMLAEPTAKSDRIFALVQNIHLNAYSLSQRLSELVDFVRLQHAQLICHPQPVDICPLVQKVVARVSPLLQNKGQGLILQLGGPLPWAKADPSRVEQVLFHLVLNASKFSPNGTDMLLHVHRLADGHLEVRVEDAAPPIDARELSLIFTPYYRGEQARHVPGSGLGLFICKQLVELQGGKIGVERQDGGNCFFFSLPSLETEEVKDESLGDRRQSRNAKHYFALL